MSGEVNLWPLLGVAVIVLGFMLRFNPMLVVILSAGAAAVSAGFTPEKILATVGTAFLKTRNLPLIILLPLAVIGLLERHGLRQHAQEWIARFRAATAGRLKSPARPSARPRRPSGPATSGAARARSRSGGRRCRRR